MFHKKRRWHCLSGQEPTELDKKVMYWEQKGKLVPTRDLIKTPEQIEGIRLSLVGSEMCIRDRWSIRAVLTKWPARYMQV